MFIGIDLLSFRVRGAAYSDLDEPVEIGMETIAVSPRIQRTFQQDHGAIYKIVEKLEEKCGRSQAVGVVLPATVPQGATKLTGPSGIPQWDGQPLAIIGKSLERRTVIGGYVEANALAELYYGSSPSEFRYIHWGKEVRGMQVSDGQATPLDIGHVRIKQASLYPCTEGHYDCLEAFVGTESLLQRFKQEMIRSLPIEAWEESCHYFARAFGLLETADLPWVFGGGMSEEYLGFTELLKKLAKAEFTIATHIRSAGTLGGLALLKHTAEAS